MNQTPSTFAKIVRGELRLAAVLALLGACCTLLITGCDSLNTRPSTKTPAGDGTVTLSDFSLHGDLTNDQAAFILSATAHVDGAHGGTLDLLAGSVALTEVGTHPHWNVGIDGNKFVLKFDHGGDYPVQIKFSAAVAQGNGWNSVGFQVAPATLQPIVLEGLAPDTQFEFAGAARADRTGSNFTSFLPSDGAVRLSWKEAPKEEEGKLFYSAEMLSQIAVGPGMMRQVALLDFKVMQGELSQVSLRVHGAGEVTGVSGDQVLAFSVEPVPDSADRLLVVKLNQPQKDQFAFQVQMQTSLAEFPLEADTMELRPEGGTRFAGYFRVVNEGAVRLEIASAKGLSQISPEQFPDTPQSRAAFPSAGGQRFAYRFSGPDFALRIRADQVIPELTVSEVLSYHLGESEQTIDGEIELDIREAPLRELLLHVPKGYAVARVAADNLSDYFQRDVPDSTNSELRLVYVQPLSGRQVVQLRLERNAALGTNRWELPRVEVVHAKSVRGNIGVAADAGFRLSTDRVQALTEIATAFFPAKPPGLQVAFRLSDPEWSAAMQVERLPQTIQADVLHLFSVGEGIAYGSSVINYVISGSPVSAFKIELPEGYTNVEFTGKDVLPPQKTDGGYVVQLHTPVSGAYTLLATYERPFKSQGETLSFTGARPLDVLSEQGYTLVISTYQFDVKPADVSTNLLRLEPGEVPPEYRLFFDAPILAAYRYTARPFNLKLELSPLTQGDSLSQVVDRATITNRISKEGQVLTDVRYFVKNRGKTHFQFTLPDATDLWSATVNGLAVVPVKDGKNSLIPLPQRADPNAVLIVDLKLARAKSADPQRLTVTAPIAGAPVMLEEWKLEPDPGQRLAYRGGSLTPVGGIADISGFADLTGLFTGSAAGDAKYWLFVFLVFAGLSVVAWRCAGREEAVKSSARQFLWVLGGVIMFVFALVSLSKLGGLAGHVVAVTPRDLTFLAPIQQADSALTVDVSNLPETASTTGFLALAWPAVLALVVWIFGWLAGRGGLRFAAWIVGWTFIGWWALRLPNGTQAFLGVIAAFLILQVALPALWNLWRMPRRPVDERPPATASGAPATLLLLLGGLAWLALGGPSNASAQTPPLAESVTQQIRVEDKFALATAKIRWDASRGDVLPLLTDPAVLTHVSYPEHSLKLEQSNLGNRRAEQLEALASGVYDIEVQYQMQVSSSGFESGFTLPTPYGLVNQLQVTLVNLDVDVVSPQAVSVQRTTEGTNTLATLVLSPLAQAQIGWHPRSRDVKREQPVFFANFYQLYVPSAGVIEGVHYVVINPSHGELSELNFDVPAGATITDVFEPVPAQNGGSRAPGSLLVSLWRFDPDKRQLRVNLRTAQSQKFALVIRSQVATGTLPVEQTVGLVSMEGAAQQNGYLGVATGSDVQLDAVTIPTNGPAAIFLGDFPAGLAQSLQGQIPGITMRRAYQYVDASGTATLKASAVEPDVRVETQDTLSLGEDRTVLAVTADVDIERAGIFKLSFLLPPGLDVDSITGKALSHWTDSKSDAGRLITLNLLGKTQGQQQFAISLTGPGIKSTNDWAVPQLLFREAGKQQGTIVVVPEQGMQLRAAARDGVAELDPQKSGIRQKGVLAFRILQAPWNLSLNIEQLEPWIQVMSLQHATINEAQIIVTANLQYQIENTGLKAFHVLVPANAEGVRFQGDQLSVFSAVDGAVTNGLQDWEIKLTRRVIGQYLLQLNYQVPMSGQATAATLRGVQADDVNTQRGFVTVQAGGRLQLRVPTVPSALQTAEWQSIPRALQKDLQAVSANFAYRLVEPAFDLPLQVERHEAEKVLPARVQSVTFNSVISDDGVVLTQARLEMIPGDKRLLSLKLPPGAKFWFAFVNQNGVWPWRDKEDNILIPLDQQVRNGRSMPVEIFYSGVAGTGGRKSLDLDLIAPKFDLPLENITWTVHLNDKWQVAKWSGQLQLQTDQPATVVPAVDSQSYLLSEAGERNAKAQEATNMYDMGNYFLANGDPLQARRAFQSAYGLSQGDDAFNEDARVQLNNIKLQQALVGLNVRQAEVAGGDAGTLGASFRDLRSRKDLNYTQQDAKDIIDRNSSDENAAFMALATRLVEQQDAAVSSPAAIRANIPEQGRVLTFQRAVAAEQWEDLDIGLKATAARAASSGTRLLILLATLVGLALLGGLARAFQPTPRREDAR